MEMEVCEYKGYKCIFCGSSASIYKNGKEVFYTMFRTPKPIDQYIRWYVDEWPPCIKEMFGGENE